MGKTGKPNAFKLHDEAPEEETASQQETAPPEAEPVSEPDEAPSDAPESEEADGEDTPETESEPETIEQLTADRDKWKAMARKHEDRAKQNAAAAQEWAKHQEATDSATSEADQATQDLTKERDSALAEVAILRAAVKHNLSEEDLELLEGLPADVIEQRAAKLAARVQPRSPRTPDPHLGRETPPSQEKPGNFLTNAFQRR